MSQQVSLEIDPKRAALLIIDVQERLVAAMDKEQVPVMERNIGILCELARRFNIPVVCSQQYPKGLGPTVPNVESALADLGDNVHRFDKVEFSVCENAAFAPIYDQLDRDQWIVTGMESHVCVYQSVRGLIARGATVHVPHQTAISRHESNRQVGLALMERLGAIRTSTEVIVFDVLKKAGGDDFKALSRLVR